MVCEEGEEPTTDRWFGEDEEWRMGIEEDFKDTGECAASYESRVTTQPPGLWAIALGSPLISLLA